MESKLLLLTFFFVGVVIALGQDTLLQETDVSHKSRRFYDANLRSMEERTERRLHDTERRLTRRLQDRIHNERQARAQSMNELRASVTQLSSELEASLTTQLEQAEKLRTLEGQLSHQQHELHKLKNSEQRLTKTVANLSELLQQLLDAQTTTTSTTTATTTAASTTPTLPPTDSPSTPAANDSQTTQSSGIPFIPIFPKDCEDVYLNGGMKYPGYYYIMLQPLDVDKPFKACCRMTNNSGWTLIQRRQDGMLDFFQDWQSYKEGFGNLEGEFWLGNELIHRITTQGDYKLRVEMEDMEGATYWAEYEHFRVEGEEDKYRLHTHGYSGNAGDSLTSQWESHDGMAFSTKDQDNDNRFYDNCAEHYHGAWWFRSCFESHLNGIYYHRGAHNNYFVRNGVQWNTIHPHSSLKATAMMVKPTEVIHEASTDQDNVFTNGIK